MASVPQNPLCNRCQQRTLMHFSITADGTRQYRWYCEKCDRCWSPDNNSGYFIPHKVVESLLSKLSDAQRISFDNERCLADYRVECAICGALGAQNHHFAPQSLRQYFGDDFEKYPQVFLCDYHHRLWHEVVTWYLPGYQQRMDEFAKRYLKAAMINAR